MAENHASRSLVTKIGCRDAKDSELPMSTLSWRILTTAYPSEQSSIDIGTIICDTLHHSANTVNDICIMRYHDWSFQLRTHTDHTERL
jgi:hypothetical protein